MKKFLFWATVVGVSFASCVSDNDEVLTLEDNPQPVTFEVAKYKSSSRAEGDNYSAFPTNQVFGTFAYKADAIQGTHTLFMDNEIVGYVNNVWVAMGDIYLWPQVGHIDFISYYPHSSNNGDFKPTISDVNAGDYNKLSFENYTVSQVDLMYSDKAHLMTHNFQTYDHSGVPTLFRHALAKLSFNVKAMYVVSDETTSSGTEKVQWQVMVNSITLNSLYGKGTVHLVTTSPASIGTTQWNIMNYVSGSPKVWTPNGGADVSKTWEVSEGQSLTADAIAFGEAQNYYVLPQSFTDKLQSVTINYSIANKKVSESAFGTPEEFTKTLYFYDYSSMAAAWEMGKHITYLITIDPKGDIINFDPAVSNWENVDGGLIM